jgi:hypothetical protein
MTKTATNRPSKLNNVRPLKAPSINFKKLQKFFIKNVIPLITRKPVIIKLQLKLYDIQLNGNTVDIRNTYIPEIHTLLKKGEKLTQVKLRYLLDKFINQENFYKARYSKLNVNPPVNLLPDGIYVKYNKIPNIKYTIEKGRPINFENLIVRSSNPPLYYSIGGEQLNNDECGLNSLLKALQGKKRFTNLTRDKIILDMGNIDRKNIEIRHILDYLKQYNISFILVNGSKTVIYRFCRDTYKNGCKTLIFMVQNDHIQLIEDEKIRQEIMNFGFCKKPNINWDDVEFSNTELHSKIESVYKNHNMMCENLVLDKYGNIKGYSFKDKWIFYNPDVNKIKDILEVAKSKFENTKRYLFRNQSIQSITGDLMREFCGELPKSNLNTSVLSNMRKFPKIPYIECTGIGTKLNSFSIDIQRCHTNILYHRNHAFGIFRPNNTIKRYRGHILEGGMYFINKHVMLGSIKINKGFYDSEFTELLINHKFINASQIRYEIIPSYTIKNTYFKTLIDKIYEIFPTYAKDLINKWIGTLGIKDNKHVNGELTNSLDFSDYWKTNGGVSKDIGTIKLLYKVIKMDVLFNNLPIYNGILDMSYWNLYNLECKVTKMVNVKVSNVHADLLTFTNPNMRFTKETVTGDPYDSDDDDGFVCLKSLMNKLNGVEDTVEDTVEDIVEDTVEDTVEDIHEDNGLIYSGINDKRYIAGMDKLNNIINTIKVVKVAEVVEVAEVAEIIKPAFTHTGYRLEKVDLPENLILKDFVDYSVNGLDIKFTERELLPVLNKISSCAIFGEGGTGKSYTIVNVVIPKLGELKKKYLVVSTSHKALSGLKVVGIKAQTIASLFYLSNGTIEMKLTEIMKTYDYIINDEYTMTSLKYMEYFYSLYKMGMKFIFVGDYRQTTPIETSGNIKLDYRKSEFFIQMCEYNRIELKINSNSRYDEELRTVALKVYNNGILDKGRSKPCKYNICYKNSTRIEGNKTFSDLGGYNIDTDFNIVVGSPIICKVNDISKKLFNNIIFEVDKIIDGVITITNENISMDVDKHTLKEKFKLAHFITIHAAQGSTFDMEYEIHDSDIMSRNILYTAITRATDIKNVYFNEPVELRGIKPEYFTRTYEPKNITQAEHIGYIYKVIDKKTKKVLYIGAGVDVILNTDLLKYLEGVNYKVVNIKKMRYDDITELFAEEIRIKRDYLLSGSVFYDMVSNPLRPGDVEKMKVILKGEVQILKDRVRFRYYVESKRVIKEYRITKNRDLNECVKLAKDFQLDIYG